MKSHCPNELVLYLATDGRRYSPLAGGVPRSQPSTLWTLKYIADGSYPLIQGSPDLVQLFVDAEAARALVRRAAGIFVNMDWNGHSRFKEVSGLDENVTHHMPSQRGRFRVEPLQGLARS